MHRMDLVLLVLAEEQSPQNDQIQRQAFLQSTSLRKIKLPELKVLYLCILCLERRARLLALQKLSRMKTRNTKMHRVFNA
jgi:hypothetical protein